MLMDGGLAGAAMRAHDWTNSPRGMPEGWRQPLKTLVGVLLAADQPMFIGWGPDHILLYNDGYADVTPVFHPASTRDRPVLLRMSAGEATGGVNPARCCLSSAAKAAGVA